MKREGVMEREWALGERRGENWRWREREWKEKMEGFQMLVQRVEGVKMKEGEEVERETAEVEVKRRGAEGNEQRYKREEVKKDGVMGCLEQSKGEDQKCVEAEKMDLTEK